MGRKCAVFGCRTGYAKKKEDQQNGDVDKENTSKGEKKIQLYSFPKDEEVSLRVPRS